MIYLENRDDVHPSDETAKGRLALTMVPSASAIVYLPILEHSERFLDPKTKAVVVNGLVVVLWRVDETGDRFISQFQRRIRITLGMGLSLILESSTVP